MADLDDCAHPCSTQRVIQGLDSSSGVVLDERGRPDFRDVFGALAQRSTRIETAVRRVRLSTFDLRRKELQGVERFRVLVAELNALNLLAEVRCLQVDPRRVRNLNLLHDMLAEGRLSVRAAPLAAWSPDFSVFTAPSGPETLLLGTHWFGRPYPHPGPVWAAIVHGDAAHLAAERHGELWSAAHDVGVAVRGILEAGRAGGEIHRPDALDEPAASTHARHPEDR